MNKKDDTIFNARTVPHETNMDNRSVFEVITGHPTRIDVIVTIKNPNDHGSEHRLACVSVIPPPYSLISADAICPDQLVASPDELVAFSHVSFYFV